MALKCSVVRNSDGNISRVNDQQGKESKLFNRIASHPLVASTQEAFDIYANRFDRKLENLDESEIGFVNQVDGQDYVSYKTALKEANEGQEIKIGFQNLQGDFYEVISAPKTTNPQTVEGLIQKGIVEGTVAENRVRVGDNYVYQSEGNSNLKKMVTLMEVEDMAKAHLGSNSMTISGNTFTLNKTLDIATVYDKEGNTQTISKQELDSLSFDELAQRYDNPVDIVSEREYGKSQRAYRDTPLNIDTDIQIRTEDELQMSLLELLNKLGVTVTSISNYITKYKIKNGVNPSAQALADIANRVVAFQAGQISTLDLTEEVAHFINEAMPQAQVENVLRNIDKSEEWQQFAAIYREIYAEEYSGEDLENAVRREVLGKVVANSIAANFETANKSATQANFITKALELINSFFTTVRSYFKPEYQRELEGYLNDVQNLFNAEDISSLVNVDNFSGNILRLYSVKTDNSVEGRFYKSTSALLQQLQQQETNLRKTTLGSAGNIAKLESIQREIDEAVKAQSVAGLILVAKNRIAEMKAAIKDSQQKNIPLTYEDKIIYQSLVKDIRPLMSQLKSSIQENNLESKEWKQQIESIDNVNKDILDIEAVEDQVYRENVEGIIKRVQQAHNLPDSDAEQIRRWITKADSDTNILLSTFGQMLHAKDGMLNLLAYTIKNMTNEGDWEWFQKTKNLQNLMRQNGVSEADLGKLFVDGRFIVSKYDMNAFNAELDKVFLETYKKFVNVGDKTDEELLKERREKTLPLMEDTVQNQYEVELRRRQDELTERTYKKEYYEEYEKKLIDNDISAETRAYLTGYFNELATIKLKSLREGVDGNTITDQSLLSSADRERLKQIQQTRREAKSYYNNHTGQLKDGLRPIQELGRNVLDENGRIQMELLPNASVEARVAYDLNKLDASNEISLEKGITKRFIDELREIERTKGRSEALEFLKMNSFIGFKSEFWNSLTGGNGVVAKLRRAEETPEVKEILNKIEERQLQLRSIMRIFGDKNNPAETDVERMSSDTKLKIKDIQEDLQTYFEQAKEYIKDITDEEIEESSFIESAVDTSNEAYKKALQDEGIGFEEGDIIANTVLKTEAQLEFALQHMTEDNKKLVRKVRDAVDSFRKGRRQVLPKSAERYLERLGMERDDLMENEGYSRFMTSYAENRLLPYYKRFAPESYDGFLNELNTVENLTEFISNLENFPAIEITPNRSFFEVEDTNNLNPNYDRNFRGGYLQPNLAKFKSKKFFDMFGDETGKKNPKLFEVYQAVMDYRFDSLEANSANRSYNAYLLPQIRKKRIEKAQQIFSGGQTGTKLRNAFEDAFSFTEDEQAFGNQIGDSVKVIPKMFTSEIEPSDVSTELFYSLTMSGRASYGRKSKIKHYGDIMSLMDVMMKKTYNGKSAQASNTFKMASSAVDYSLYGIKETASYPVHTPFGNIDLAKIARALHDFVKIRNLGFNLVIPFTSYATAKLNILTETLIGQYLHPTSQKLGSAEFARLRNEGMKEFGKINTAAEINLLGQHFRSFDLDESYKNSNYNGLFRGMDRSGMALHAMANYPIYGKIMMSVLYDYRVVDGKMMNFNQYSNQQRILGKDRKLIKADWNGYEKFAVRNFLTVENQAITYNGNVEGQSLKDLMPEADINQINNTVTNQIRIISEFIDGSISQEDRSLAQRSAYLNFLTTHKNYLTIATSRRFKSRHINLQTGITEEGSYVSFWNFLGRYVAQYKESGIKGVLRNFKEAYNKGDDTERANVIRVGKEFAVLNAVVLLAAVLKNFADDDENKDLYSLQLGSYLMYRIASETTSTNLNIGSNYTAAIKDPVVGFNSITNLIQVQKLFDGDEVARGKYQGLSEREKYLISNSNLGKQVFDLYNINRTRTDYEYFQSRDGNFDYTLGSTSLWADEESEE